ncbi:MAG: hypothetical protein M3R30_03565 [Candidatus Eremiobacteraeota bacterium]|nr:hypothetical protein [Candidatus Eremiobacteraeota bacterium]
MSLQHLSLVCAGALAIGVLGQAPVSAAQQGAFEFVTPAFHLAGGTINCSSGCTEIFNDDGSIEIDLGNGESMLELPDGTLVGAP